ncbi:DUF1203 domain-containing protein [Sinorhizobium medicae]|uniref:DUF1203 domain-containing protein n=3 Tax=Sinorhizobium medicae TaxID=110321 RepID=A0A508WST5_9HYPH|nr:DUF1203 domain-containing protein [Sinorhizobium medicae]ABR60215.1 protein of unknown function DUF1203 [Sinorhizobium medicae WSM419]MBO1940228.1 DUF1203 domain-containing protein [Sinorhizobium medicae]MBO1962287.1 DUF1203 domain-containing protein [Sinorhizobium medicae]MDX0408726.1 DUF1203 domain-containing protein [Sinorhizobium medicae]MDX0413938.1 DUF1203 domain-containing protein [Sinorhizobium medicae]
MNLHYIAMSVQEAERLRQGGRDAYGAPPERRISDGDGVPCRHCLRNVDEGKPYLTLAYRPFSSVQAYSETGPIFMHAEYCTVHDGRTLPPILASSKSYLLRGYGSDERIVYGTGGAVDAEQIEQRAEELLARPDVAFLHVRSAKYNCYQCRIEAR